MHPQASLVPLVPLTRHIAFPHPLSEACIFSPLPRTLVFFHFRRIAQQTTTDIDFVATTGVQEAGVQEGVRPDGADVLVAAGSREALQEDGTEAADSGEKGRQRDQGKKSRRQSYSAAELNFNQSRCSPCSRNLTHHIILRCDF